MGGEPECAQDLAHLLVRIVRIQTHHIHPLLLLLGRLRTLQDEAVEGRPHRFHIMPIDPFHYPGGYPISFHQQAALDAALAPVGGIGTGFSPA